MPTSLVDSDSLLAVDVGTVTTRVVLFDVVEGNYRFVAAGQAATTIGAPFKDVREGVRAAIDNLQSVTGRRFLGGDQHLIMPAEEGQGVDLFAATLSAGPPIKTVVVGLLGDVSVESVQRLARSTYARVVDTITLNDPRKPHEQIDSILQCQPDLFLIAGGTEDGATRSIQRLIETVSLICQILPEDKRPAVLFAGNQKLVNVVKIGLQTMVSSLTISPNLRPTIEIEDLGPAQHALNELYPRIRGTQTLGVDELDSWSSNTLIPTAYAMARIIRFLSQDANTGVLGVDVGAGHTTVAAGFGGNLTLGVYPQLGLGEPISGLLRYTSLEEIMKWLPMDIPAEDVRDYLYQKSIYPASLPASPEDLAIEQAAARQALFLAFSSAVKDFPPGIRRPAPGLPPYFEPILAGGSVITRAPKVEQSLLLLLDALQPMGITTIILDQNNLLPALGAAAARSPILPVQVFESLAFRYLATVVAPSADARPGTPILNARLIYQNGNETRIEIQQGALEILPLSPGQAGRLYLEPAHHADIGLGPGHTRSNGFPVSGTILGVVIDARGRPLRLPADAGRRRDLFKKWLWTLGG
jgi:MutL protein